MKKIFKILIIFFCLQNVAFAASIRVVASEDYETQHPKQTFSVQTAEEYQLETGEIIDAGTIIEGKVIKIRNAGRAKRDAYFDMIPIAYTYNCETHTITNCNFKLRVVDYVPLDKKGMVLSAGKSAAGFLVKGAAQGISFIQGVVSPEEDVNRISSGLTKVYKDSPLSYVEKGDELTINKGDMIIIKVYNNKKD